MLTTARKNKLLTALKNYRKNYLHGKLTELDESGTRLMVNTFLTDVLGFTPIEEIKTEYMIRGTYADYVIQTKETRHFLVEVKALSFALSEKHLRQAINYGANEGIEWALLTNGRQFDFHKIIFNKPIESRLIFSFDLSDNSTLKECLEVIQYLHKESIINKGLNSLWSKNCALDPVNIAGMLYAKPVINFIKRTLKQKYKSKFSEEEINSSLNRLFTHSISLQDLKPLKTPRSKKKTPKSNPELSSSAREKEDCIEYPVANKSEEVNSN